jgi:hypothetical protein
MEDATFHRYSSSKPCVANLRVRLFSLGRDHVAGPGPRQRKLDRRQPAITQDGLSIVSLPAGQDRVTLAAASGSFLTISSILPP